MSLEFTKISGSTPYFLNSASTAEELTVALEDYMRTGTQIIFQHDGEDCILSSFEYRAGIDSTVIAYFVTPKKKLLKVDTAAGLDLVITESEITPELDKTLTQENKAADAKATGEAITSLKSTINDLHTDVEIYLIGEFVDGTRVKSLYEYITLTVSEGVPVKINIMVVDDLPDTLIPITSLTGPYNIYVINSTGIAYGCVNNKVQTIGSVLFGADRGWTTDINAETENGFYCVRVVKDLAEKKDITWENLPDKPFGEVTENLGDTVTWDGNLDTFKGVKTEPVVGGNDEEGIFTIQYVKVSDSVPTVNDIVSGSTIKYIQAGSEHTFQVYGQESDGIIVVGDGVALIATIDNCEFQTIVFPKKGVYFLHSTFDSGVTQYGISFTIPNYNFVNTTIKKIDEKYLPESVISGNKTNSGVEIYIVSGERDPMASYEFVAQYGMTIDIQLVKTLPDSLEQTVIGLGNTVYAYVVENTGIAYCDIGQGVMPLGLVAFEAEGYDKGWSADINSETEIGVYCVRTSGDSTVKLIKKTFVGMQSVAGFLYANPNLTIFSATLNDTDFSVSVPNDDGGGSTGYICNSITSLSMRREEIGTNGKLVVVKFERLNTIGLITVQLSMSNIEEGKAWAQISLFDGTSKEGTFTDLRSGSITCLFYE